MKGSEIQHGSAKRLVLEGKSPYSLDDIYETYCASDNLMSRYPVINPFLHRDFDLDLPKICLDFGFQKGMGWMTIAQLVDCYHDGSIPLQERT